MFLCWGSEAEEEEEEEEEDEVEEEEEEEREEEVTASVVELELSEAARPFCFTAEAEAAFDAEAATPLDCAASAAVAAAAAAADDRVTRLWTEEGAPSPSPIEEDREVSCCVAIVLRVSLGPPIPPSLPRATKRVCPSVPRQEHGAMETAREDKQRGAGKVGTSARGSTLRAARLIQVGGAR